MSDERLLESYIKEAIQIHPDYMKKERVRQAIQDVITNLVSSGEISNKQELENFFSSADMSLRALKMVPYETYAKLAGKTRK